jgi:hypothetical protein
MATGKQSKIRAVILAQFLALHAQSPNVNPYAIAAIVERLQKAARGTVARLTKACNYPITEREQENIDAWIKRQETALNATLESEFANKYGVEPPTVSMGGDPRGPCVFLKIPGRKGDGWDSDAGFGVY